VRDLIVACVRVGSKYGAEYVERLYRGVQQHLSLKHQFVCIGDSVYSEPGITSLVSEPDLPGWWAKMGLFKPWWRRGAKVIYLDLDTIVVGDLTPLAAVSAPFAICGSFVREAGNTTWPCRYGSCVMVLGADHDGEAWAKFYRDRHALMKTYSAHGDQKLIEALLPDAQLLQPMLPNGFFLNYRNLKPSMATANGASLVIFGGKARPHNCVVPWMREQWAAKQVA
jgi:hypothetical protein